MTKLRMTVVRVVYHSLADKPKDKSKDNSKKGA
jgi:hypothetical protein